MDTCVESQSVALTNPAFATMPTMYAGVAPAETAVGPFFIGGSVGDSGHRKWFFQLGRVF